MRMLWTAYGGLLDVWGWMASNKPMTELARLLGYKTNKELGVFLGIPVDTVNNINSGRGSENKIEAYKYLCKALNRIPADERRAIFEARTKPKLRTSQKYRKTDELKRKIPEKAAESQRKLESALDSLNELVNMQIEYEELNEK